VLASAAAFGKFINDVNYGKTSQVLEKGIG